MRHIVASATRLACRRRDRRAVIPAAPRSQHVHAEPVACPQDRRCVSPAKLTLFSSVFIAAVRGLVYELAVGAWASYLLGDWVLQFSTVIGAGGAIYDGVMPKKSTQVLVTQLDPLQPLLDKGFDVKLLSHAGAIASGDFPGALAELVEVLSAVELPITEIIGSGGGETRFTQRLRRALAQRDWRKHHFEIAKTVDGVPRESTSHEVDHVKRFSAGVIACEIEWNNKDPFFDRDLENFKRLHAEGAISLGVLVTRGASLQDALWDAVMRFAIERGIHDIDALTAQGVVPTPKQRVNILRRSGREGVPVPFAQAWVDNFVSNKFGQATTHWAKLMSRVGRGVGNPCPLLLIGLPASIVVFDGAPVEAVSDEDLATGA